MTNNNELQTSIAALRLENKALKRQVTELESDVAEHKITQLRLSQQENKLRTIIDSQPAWVNVCDDRGVIIEVNPAGIDIMEASSDKDLIGKRLADFIQDNTLTNVKVCIDCLHSDTIKQSDIEVKTLKGNTRWLEVSTVLLPEMEGEEMHVMSIISDQTLYKEAHQELMNRQEELSQVMRLNTLGAMASGLAHELNQPLSAISNYLSGCERRVKKDGCQQGEVLEALSLASRQTQRAGGIINHVKHFVQQDELALEPLDINQIIRESVELFEATVLSGNVKYKLILENKLPDVAASNIQLEQVLINLFRNAVEAMQEAEIQKPLLTIRSYLNSEESSINISVEDNGKGVDQLVQESIFQPFRTSKEEGMGMGLCISRSIIEGYDGNLSVSNSKEGGAIFSFDLPIGGIE